MTVFSETDLVLTDNAGLIQTTSSNPAYMGLLSNILVWHAEDPVDDLERHRADVVWQHQGNRNPFNDHPEWANCIFAGIDCVTTIFGDGFESGDTGAWAAVSPQEPVAQKRMVEFGGSIEAIFRPVCRFILVVWAKNRAENGPIDTRKTPFGFCATGS